MRGVADNEFIWLWCIIAICDHVGDVMLFGVDGVVGSARMVAMGLEGDKGFGAGMFSWFFGLLSDLDGCDHVGLENGLF